MKTYFRKAPTLLLIASSALILTMFALAGKDNIYREQPYHYSQMPMLTLVFQGVNENRYPWMMFFVPSESKKIWPASVLTADITPSDLNIITDYNQDQPEEKSLPVNQAIESTLAVTTLLTGPASDNKDGPVITDLNEPAEIKPLRSTTKEEAQNYISVDIYGSAGVERAATYEFVTVDESYFDDALFIGDSRTVGLCDYSSISEHGDFLCATALTVHKIFDGDIGGNENVESLLQAKDYSKIYLSVGINELGRGTTENFTETYRDVVNKLRELEPGAIIFVQGVMKVSKDKSDGDAIYNNSNIEARNRAIATLADNQHVFYIDVNEVMCDDEGNLHEGYTHDGIHLLGSYIETHKQFLLAHGTAD